MPHISKCGFHCPPISVTSLLHVKVTLSFCFIVSNWCIVALIWSRSSAADSKEDEMSEFLIFAELLGHLVAGVYCLVVFFIVRVSSQHLFTACLDVTPLCGSAAVCNESVSLNCIKCP
jgi:hypothetical protein